MKKSCGVLADFEWAFFGGCVEFYHDYVDERRHTGIVGCAVLGLTSHFLLCLFVCYLSVLVFCGVLGELG